MAGAGTIEIFLTANTAGLQSGLRRAESRLEKAERRLQSFGSSMTTGVTLPIVGAGAAAGAAAVSIENAMTGVAKTVDAPQEEINALREEFEAMSEEIPVSTQELADMGRVAGQLGVPVDQIRDFVETTAALKVSTDLGAEEAAIEVARLNNVMGAGTQQADRTGSALVALGNNIEAMEGEILRTTTFFRTMASSAGASTAEVLGLAGALRRAGVRAQAGGSGIMVTFQEMQKAVEGVSGELDTFARVAGMSGEEFAGLFERDATEALLRFLEGLERMRRSGEGMTQVLDQLGLSGRRVSRALGGLSADTDKTREAVEISTEAYENNIALVEEAQKFYDRLGADFKTFANEAVNTAASLGRELAPSFRTMLDAGRSAMDVIAEMVKLFAGLPAPVQATAIGLAAVGASLGPVAFGVSQVLGAIRGLFGMLSGLTGAIAGGSGLVAALGTLGTTLAVGGAVVGAVLGFSAIFQELTDNVEEARQAADKFIDSTEGMSAAALKRNREVLRERQEQLLEARDRMQDTLEEWRDGDAPERLIAGKEDALEQTKRDLRMVNDQLRAVDSQIRERQQLPPITATVSGGGGEGGTAGGDEDLTDREKALQSMRRQVQTVRRQEALLGDRFDHNAELARVYRQNIRRLLEAGFAPQSDAVQHARSEYLQYQRAVEKVEEAQERQRREQQRVNSAVQTSKNLLRSSRTPMERHEERLQKINRALEAGRITQRQASRARRQSRKKMEEAARETGQTLEEEMNRAGRSAMQALISGFIRGKEDFGSRLKNVALSLVEQFLTSKIVGFLGIASPSTVAMGWGESLVEGFARGIEGHASRLDRAVGSTFSLSAPGALSTPSGLTAATGRIRSSRPSSEGAADDLRGRAADAMVQAMERVDLDLPSPEVQAGAEYQQRLTRRALEIASADGHDPGFGGRR